MKMEKTSSKESPIGHSTDTTSLGADIASQPTDKVEKAATDYFDGIIERRERVKALEAAITEPLVTPFVSK